MPHSSQTTQPSLAISQGQPLEDDECLGVLTLPQLFLELTECYRDNPALLLEGTSSVPELWSYAKLRAEAMAVAQSLIALGINKGDRIGVLMPNTPQFIASVFGIALAGGVATMLSTFSTRDELAYLLKQSACSVLLFEPQVANQDFCAALQEIAPEIKKTGRLHSINLPFLRHVVSVDTLTTGAITPWQTFIDYGRATSQNDVFLRAKMTTPADPGVLFFSSGSTNKPKGILSSHRGVCIQMWRMQTQQGLAKGVRSWTANGFFWSGNFAMVIGATLVAGGALVLQSLFEPEQALQIISRGQAEFVFAWPHQWAQLVNGDNWLDVDLSSVRYVDPSCPLATHPTISSDWIEPRYCYGNTETFTLVSGFPAGTTVEQSKNSHGRPFPGNTIKVIDPLTGATLGINEPGEIAVKGPTLMLGYLGVPLDTTLDSEGFLRTGDGGHIDSEGRLFWSGRLTDIIKTGGANVSPLEVDDVLRSMEGVKLCQTVGIPHETLGEMVVSCVVPDGSLVLNEDLVRAYTRQHLASYKTPRRVLFFSEDDIALTGTAKIKTSDLRSLAEKHLGA